MGLWGAALLRGSSPSSSPPLLSRRRALRRGAGWLACSALEAQVSLFCEVSQQETTAPCSAVQMGPSAGPVPSARCSSPRPARAASVGSFWTSPPQRSGGQKVSEGSEISEHWRGLQIHRRGNPPARRGFIKAVLFLFLKKNLLFF